MAVHSELGCGYLEAVYRAALKCEFRRRAIAFEHEVSLPIHYKGDRTNLSRIQPHESKQKKGRLARVSPSQSYECAYALFDVAVTAVLADPHAALLVHVVGTLRADAVFAAFGINELLL